MTARFPNLGRATKYIKFIACHRQSVSGVFNKIGNYGYHVNIQLNW